MEHKTRTVSADMLAESLPEMLTLGTNFPLQITGNSMAPFLVHGRDTAFLSRAEHPLKKGDMILYRRDNGMLVLHRIIRVENGMYTLVGDAQTELEPGIRPEQVLAVVNSVYRKGRRLDRNSFLWFVFDKLWLRMVPLRPLMMSGYGCLRKLFK